MEREPNEYDLALQARDGDREALAELVERTRLRLFALAYAELRHYEDAQDAVAAALLQICLHVGELRQPESILDPWMRSIVRNEVRRLRRGPCASVTSLDAVEVPLGLGAERAGGRSPAELLPAEDDPALLRMDIERALRRLPTHQAQAIRLFYLEDLSAAEVAERMGRTQAPSWPGSIAHVGTSPTKWRDMHPWYPHRAPQLRTPSTRTSIRRCCRKSELRCAPLATARKSSSRATPPAS